MKTIKSSGVLFLLKSIALASACAFMVGSASANLTLIIDTGKTEESDVILTLVGSFDTSGLTASESYRSSERAWMNVNGLHNSGNAVKGSAYTFGESLNLTMTGELVSVMQSGTSGWDIGSSSIWFAPNVDLSTINSSITFAYDDWKDAEVSWDTGTVSYGDKIGQNFTIKTIPEPASLGLLGLVCVGMIVVRRIFRM